MCEGSAGPWAWKWTSRLLGQAETCSGAQRRLFDSFSCPRAVFLTVGEASLLRAFCKAHSPLEVQAAQATSSVKRPAEAQEEPGPAKRSRPAARPAWCCEGSSRTHSSAGLAHEDTLGAQLCRAEFSLPPLEWAVSMLGLGTPTASPSSDRRPTSTLSAGTGLCVRRELPSARRPSTPCIGGRGTLVKFDGQS